MLPNLCADTASYSGFPWGYLFLWTSSLNYLSFWVKKTNALTNCCDFIADSPTSYCAFISCGVMSRPSTAISPRAVWSCPIAQDGLGMTSPSEVQGVTRSDFVILASDALYWGHIEPTYPHDVIGLWAVRSVVFGCDIRQVLFTSDH